MSVRVERLQDITEDDARAEGVRKPHECGDGTCPCDGLGRSFACEFMQLWDGINGERPGCSWADSPWVWRVEFRRVG